MSEPLKHIQTVLHDMEGQQAGQPRWFGNCVRTAIACLMRLPINDVPAFEVGYWSEDFDWIDALEKWAKAAHNMALRWAYDRPENGYTIASGKSPRDVGHVCVYSGGELWHDVHPSGEGLKKDSEEYWLWFEPITG